MLSKQFYVFVNSIHCSRCTKYYGTEEVVGSNCSSSNRSSSNINLKDWSQVFAEDGRFRFDEILPLLDPSPDFTKKELGYYNQTVECARWALSSYNQQNGVGYEFVAPMLSNVLFIKEPQRTYGFHANFFAKLKNTDSPLELFFAEVVACGLSRGQVVKCCILTPQLCGSSPVAMASDFAMILHPEYMRCDQCNRDMVPYDSSDSD
ncbi:2-C-methyl-D-erythritol 4-phosphate cytidylyltransferase [Bienertia sinuspersici]